MMMKICQIQMDMKLGDPAYNFARAELLIEKAAWRQPNVICLPETWNVGFFPREGLAELADRDGQAVREQIGGLARRYGVNLVAGSAAVRRTERACVTNTALVFDRAGDCVAEYDKVHLFTNMEEERYFTAGDRLCVFELDGVRCGLITCYDLRFVEWVRKTALAGIDILFVGAQWPASRRSHWRVLNRARAIENQIFVAATNSCGVVGTTRYGGHSLLVDPLGDVLAEAGDGEEILETEIDLSELAAIRAEIPVFRDRREELY